MKIKFILLSLILLITISAQSQVLISILLGDKLNSDKIEFGIVGGFNKSYFDSEIKSTGLGNYNLGFYFHILINNNSYLSTGVLVKSTLGAGGMDSYPIGDPDFDDVYKDATLSTKVSYFHVPILFQQRFFDIMILEAGFQTGLRSNAYDNFNMEAYDGDVSYSRKTSENYTRLDFGLLGGMGFKLSKKPKSMSIGLNYYYGLVNVSKLADTRIKNSSIYLYMKIPIGVQKKE